jgi:hypothetical protein
LPTSRDGSEPGIAGVHRLLELVAAILAGTALAAAYAGPLHLQLPIGNVSVRTLSRPVVAALLVLAIRVWFARGPSFLQRAVAAVSRTVLGAVIVAGLVGWIVFRSDTCGGADSYGYVSAAERVLAGRLIEHEPLAALLPFPDGIAAACPLGYVPSGREAGASVPAYPLGLPVVMAVAIASLGSAGPYWVAPLTGLLLLAASVVAARRWFEDASVALVACALLPLQPVVFAYAIQPMSDVPAAAAIMTALALVSRPGSLAAAVAAGVAGGAALLIRPALAPAVAMIAALPAMSSDPRRWRMTVGYLTPVAIAATLQAWQQDVLYGSPFASGYGSVAGLFSIDTALTNIRSHAYWGWWTLGPLWLAATAIGVSATRGTPRRAITLVGVGVAAPYVFYRPYDHWETLRFLLPALVPATIVAASGLLVIARAVAGAHALAVAALVVSAAAVGWTSWLSSQQVFSMPQHEARHRLAGELVAQATPENAVVLALQHSGSLRYYARRQTINWDRIPSGMLATTTRALQSRGHTVYLMIDSAAERALFEAKHGAALDADGWLPNGQRRNVQLFEAASAAPPP